MDLPWQPAGLLAFAQRGSTASGVAALQYDPNFYEFLNEFAMSPSTDEPASPSANFLTTCQALFNPNDATSGTSSSSASDVPFPYETFPIYSQPSGFGTSVDPSPSPYVPLSYLESGQSGKRPPSVPGKVEPLPSSIPPHPTSPGKQHKKITRTERQRRAVAEMEQQIQTKLAELDLLTQENRQLQMRFNILEVACDRQQLALGLLAQLKSGDLSSPSPLFPSMPDGPVCTAADLQWAMQLTLQSYKEWWLTQLQHMSALLVQVDVPCPDPSATQHIHQLVSLTTARICLAWLFSPIVVLKLKKMNLSTEAEAENLDAHWLEVLSQNRMTMDQVIDVKILYASYQKLHGSLTAQLTRIQTDLADHLRMLETASMTEDQRIESGQKQLTMMMGTRTVLQKMHMLFSATIAVSAQKVLRPVEFARCCVQSYPYFPCGVSMIQAGARKAQLMGLKPEAETNKACAAYKALDCVK